MRYRRHRNRLPGHERQCECEHIPRSGKKETQQEHYQPRYCPRPLCPLEVRDAVPRLISPSPLIALGTKYEVPDNGQNEYDERYIGPVEKTPDP